MGKGGQRWLGSLGLVLGLLLSGPAGALEDAAVDNALRFAQQQLAQTASQLPASAYPKSTLPDGMWRTNSATDMIAWTQGFFPGCLWSMHELTGDPVWRTRADGWTRGLEVQRSNRQTHDLGFKFMSSYGHAYRLTGDAYYKDVL